MPTLFCPKFSKLLFFSISTPLSTICYAQDAADPIENVTVYSDRLFVDTNVVSPSSRITEQELQSINVTTTEDVLAHEPNLIIRRRFIGDPNGVLGIRGSNMFQGSRTMVFADGMPLHYHLQTRYSGSPRWSLVAPSEIAEAEVIYGPFSAEYSGNAMGGVVNMTTKIPDSPQVVLEASIFNQDYSVHSTDENYLGNKLFASVENKIGDLSLYASYNRLQNDGQPMTQYESSASASDESDSVVGGVAGIDESNNDVIYYGDSGAESTQTDLLKLKANYDFGNAQLRASVAYEQRQRDDTDHNNYLTDLEGNIVWSGTGVVDGQSFSISGSNFQQRHQDRESLLVGLGISGLVGKSEWAYDGFYSDFRILKDEEIRSGRNPDDPDYVAVNESFGGRLTEYEDTGWQIFDLKLGTLQLAGDERQRLSVGMHWDAYRLNIITDDYDAINGIRDTDELDGDLSTGRSDSGGEANTLALFAQYGFKLSEQWDLALGLRAEEWQTENGYTGGTEVDKRTESGLSPKFSIGYFPSGDLALRYSIARALRFPVMEELYRNDGSTDSGSVFISDPTLAPEDGIFQNLSLEKYLAQGSVKFNLFHDIVEDVIFNQSTSTDSGTVTTALPVDEVKTQGAEFIYNQRKILGSAFDVRFNLSYTDTEITENVLNPDYVGNAFPRMPRWRSNLILRYQIQPDISVAANMRYASNSYGRLDNEDTASNVFGAQDSFLLLGTKLNWSVTPAMQLSAGIDNITNQEIYSYHPYPSRTYYLQAKYQFGF